MKLDDSRKVYIHASKFGGGDLSVGMRLHVIVEADPRNPGKWCVAEVLPDGLHMAVPPLRPAQNQWTPSRAFNATTPVPFDRGTVEDWNAQGGYGFLRLDDGRKVYIHASKFGGGDLSVGMRLRVLVEADPRNPGKFSVGEVLGEETVVSQNRPVQAQ